MTNLLTLSPADFCAATKACSEGREFALRHQTMAEVWDNCPRPDWSMWICDQLGQRPDHRALRLFAVWCARHTPLRDGRVTGDLITDPRLRAALDVAERYADGRATDEELSAAHAAANAAADDAYAAARAARAANAAVCVAYDAVHAANAAICATYDAAARAARDAAYDADAYDAADAAIDVAYHAARAACAPHLATAAFRDADAAAYRAALDAARAAQADQFRRVVANPFRP